jgi:hypothetical protein
MIIASAIKIKNKVFYGYSHDLVYLMVKKKYPKASTMELGFINDNGDFLDREQSYNEALKAKQIKGDNHKEKLLTSELILACILDRLYYG